MELFCVAILQGDCRCGVGFSNLWRFYMEKGAFALFDKPDLLSQLCYCTAASGQLGSHSSYGSSVWFCKLACRVLGKQKNSSMKERYCFSLETDKKLPWKLRSLPLLPKIVSKPKQWGNLLSETICRPKNKGLYSNRRHSSNTEKMATREQRLTVHWRTDPRLPLPSASRTTNFWT
jgi:hypothetical protein